MENRIRFDRRIDVDAVIAARNAADARATKVAQRCATPGEKY